jgi:hypothetical protein
MYFLPVNALFADARPCIVSYRVLCAGYFDDLQRRFERHQPQQLIHGVVAATIEGC